MRYKKEIIIAGAHALRRANVEFLYQEQKKNFEEEERILQQYADDQPKIERIAGEIARKADRGEEITNEFLKTAFVVTQNHWPKVRTLGLDNDALAKVSKKITDKENEINRLEAEPLRLVDFLEAIEDDMVSDYGIKAAGFSVKMADLITKGLEELRAKETTGQEEEAAS